MNPRKLICICGSAGALHFVQELVSEVTKTTKVPIVVLLHQQANRHSFLANVFQRSVTVPVHSPEDKEEILDNVLYIAPPSYHLQIEPDYTFSYTSDEPVKFSMPSIDVLLETAAIVYQSNLTVILLSGASDDGTDGVKYVLRYGGKVFVQSPEEAEYKTMVSAAIKAHPTVEAVRVQEMIDYFKTSGGM